MNNINLSNPIHLYTLAHLFHVKAKDYKTARVLVLGLSAITGLVAFAHAFPETQIVGIEEDQKKIASLQAMISKFNLKNIQLIHSDFCEAHSELNLFDYIICHEVYSYYSEITRDKLMALCARHLAPEGVVYMSYNTLPGWNRLKSIREMILYHVSSFNTADEKMQQVQPFLNFLVESLGNESTPYARFLKQEIQILSQQSYDEIYRQYVAPINYACYFHQFIKQANDHKLAYLSDSDLAMMFAGNLKDRFKAQVETLTDVVYAGQYMDFIRNQRSRSTLLCHQEVGVNRNLAPESLQNFYIAYGGIYKGIIDKKAMAPGQILEFHLKGSMSGTLSLSSTLAKFIMKILHDEMGRPISYVSLIKKVVYASRASSEAIQAVLNQELNLARLLLAGFIKLYPDKGFKLKAIPNKPQTTPFIQSMAELQEEVPNLLNEIYRLTAIERILLHMLKGQKTTQQLLLHFESLLAQKIQNKEWSLKDNAGQVVDNEAEIKKQIKQLSKASLESLMARVYCV